LILLTLFDSLGESVSLGFFLIVTGSCAELYLDHFAGVSNSIFVLFLVECVVYLAVFTLSKELREINGIRADCFEVFGSQRLTSIFFVLV
jgi:hypothetical protein